MDYITGVVIQVRDLDASCKLLCEVLDFDICKASDTSAELTNGALTLHLQESSGETHGVELSMEVKDITESFDRLNRYGFDLSWHKGSRVAGREDAMLKGPQDIRVRVYHVYDEDELGMFPPLPTSFSWDEKAVSLTQKLLTHIPLTFRDSARRKVVQQAESDGIVEGVERVDLDLACRAIVKVTPDFKHDQLKEAMHACSVNPAPFFDRQSEKS